MMATEGADSRLSRPSGSLRAGLVLLAVVLGAALAPAGTLAADGARPRRLIDADLRFAAEMAGQGLWREALFRWERVLKDRPEDARLLNNIAVAYEALGDFAKAGDAYARAAKLSGDKQVVSNWALFKKTHEVAPAAPSSTPSGTNP